VLRLPWVKEEEIGSLLNIFRRWQIVKAALRRRWRATWQIISEYIFPGNGARTLRECMLFVLERVQAFFARSPETGPRKKRGRLLRRTLPALTCLLVGFFLFIPVHAQSVIATRGLTTTSVRQPVGVRDNTTGCPNPPSLGGQKVDAITGLPLPEPGTSPCAVPNPTACVTANTSPTITSADATDDWFFGSNSGLLTQTPYLGTPYWQIIETAALALLAIPLILAGYQIMLGMASTHYAGAIQILSRVLLVALLTVASSFFIQAMINLESAIAVDLSNITNIQSIARPASYWCLDTQQFFSNLYNLTVYQTQNAAGTLTGTDYATANYSATVALTSNLPNDVLTLLSIVLAAQLLVRLALLNLYIIVSPLAIISGSLPGEIGKGIAWGWVRGFLALLFVPLLQILALGLGAQLVPGTLTTGTDWFNQALSELLPIIFMIITLNIPRLFSMSATSLLSTVSSSISGAMTSVILIVRGF
jgi:hypothetical protein